MTRADDKIINELIEDSRSDPYYSSSKWAIERLPNIFNGNYEKYVKTKRMIAEKIGVDGCCIVFVGSCCTGFSLSPHKDDRLFNENSDIDIAIISDYYFTIAWRCIRNVKLWKQVKETQDAIQDHVSRLIYHGTIATDKILGLMPFAKEWLEAISELGTIKELENRDIHFRLYKDFESLRSYHLYNFRNIGKTQDVNPSEIQL